MSFLSSTVTSWSMSVLKKLGEGGRQASSVLRQVRPGQARPSSSFFFFFIASLPRLRKRPPHPHPLHE